MLKAKQNSYYQDQLSYKNVNYSQITEVKSITSFTTNSSDQHDLSMNDLPTPKKEKHSYQMNKKQSMKVYCFEFSLINLLVIFFSILLIGVGYYDYSAKKLRLLSEIKFAIKECDSSFNRNKCAIEGPHLKFQHVYQKCLRLQECRNYIAQQELMRKLSISGIIGQIIKDFFKGLGVFYASILILLIFSLGWLTKGKQKITCQIKKD